MICIVDYSYTCDRRVRSMPVILVRRQHENLTRGLRVFFLQTDYKDTGDLKIAAGSVQNFDTFIGMYYGSRPQSYVGRKKCTNPEIGTFNCSNNVTGRRQRVNLNFCNTLSPTFQVLKRKQHLLLQSALSKGFSRG